MTQGFPSPPEARARAVAARRMWLAVAAILLLIVAGTAYAWMRGGGGYEIAGASGSAKSPADNDARAPAGTRVVVRVVNATGIRGLARSATLVLRDFGYDVVDYDSEQSANGDTTRILVHTGHTEWAEQLRRALGVGAIGSSSDTSRYVDLTVLLGRDWQAPTDPLRP